MSYLSFEDYQKLDGRASEEKFNHFYMKAEALLENITNNFYIRNDITADVEFRSSRFKKALVAQITTLRKWTPIPLNH
ncbi:hypothetical protein [Candidatus Enterococcus ferrettii]|uniref:Uncharacterized protein n=1 Tax=Candidatus Enterococcus ferrettii TaxID=2815324 RepID=A0ABV0EWJ2_9ENTE